MVKTLDFLEKNCTQILYKNYNNDEMCLRGVRGVLEIQRMLTILSALFDKYILRDSIETCDVENFTHRNSSGSCATSETGSEKSSGTITHDTVISSFVYAYIWAFGGNLHERYLNMYHHILPLHTTMP